MHKKYAYTYFYFNQVCIYVLIFAIFLQKISENQKKKDGRELEFSEKCERIIAYWNFLSSDPIAKRLDTPTQADRVKKLIR